MTFDELCSHFIGVKHTKPTEAWALCSNHGDHEPSLQITDKGNKRVLHCWAGCKNRDILRAVELDYRALYNNDSTNRMAGVRAALAEHGVRSAQASSVSPDQKAVSDRMERARAMWRAATLLDSDTRAGRWARTYLESRGVDRAGLPARATMSLGRPCLVWPISDGHGHLIGIQREWGRGKTNKRMVGRHKIGEGSAGFGGVLFHHDKNDGSDIAYIAEGQLTGAWGAQVMQEPVMSLLNVIGLQNCPLDWIENIGWHKKKIIILTDSGPKGVAAAEACAQRILDRWPQANIVIAIPPEFSDWLDYATANGDDAARLAIAANARRPEPPKPRTIKTSSGGEIQILRLPQVQEPARASLKEAQAALARMVKAGLEMGGPHLLRPTTGAGKTDAVCKAACGGRSPLLILCPQLTDVWEVVAKIPGAAGHKGRCVESCFRFAEMQPLLEGHRTPGWICEDCKHGKVNTAIEDLCGYMRDMRNEKFMPILIATHAAAQEDSTLMDYMSDPLADSKKRQIIIDEKTPIDSKLCVKADDLRLVQQVLGETLTAGRMGKKRFWDMATDEERERAINWGRTLQPMLARLAGEMADSTTSEIRMLTRDTWEGFVKHLKRVPLLAHALDGTAAEAVRLVHGHAPVIPMRFLQQLARSIERGTAYITQGEIHGATPARLFELLMNQGGILLDATPTQDVMAQFRHRDGHIHTLHVEEPHVSVTAITGQLHGRGNVSNKEGLGKEAAAIRHVLKRGDACITHSPIMGESEEWAKKQKVLEMGYWGKDERAHNRWKDAPRIHLWGLRIPSPQEQQTEYLIYETRMRELGVGVPGWDGKTARYIIEGRPGSAVRLPTDPHIRAWLIDRVSAEAAQAIGRGRGCWHTAQNPLEVIIHSSFPVLGHGIQIHKVQLGPGRLATRVDTRQAVAAGIVDMGEAYTKKGISDFVYRQSDKRISNTTLDNVVCEIRIYARTHGLSLVEAARRICLMALKVIKVHKGDAEAALTAVLGKEAALDMVLWALTPSHTEARAGP